MDRPIDPFFERKQKARRILIGVGFVGLIAVLIRVVPSLVTPAVSRAAIRTARVERGPIESVITASGKVVPESEQVVSSPIDARVVKILKLAGTPVSAGEPILQLDVGTSVLAFEKINQELALRTNSQEKAKLTLQDKINDLQSRYDLKKLDWQSFKSQVAQNRKLLASGLVSEEVLRQSELQESKAFIELQQIETSRKNAEDQTKTELEGLDLQIQTLRKERDEAQRELDLATTRADREGVLTWVVQEEGATVRKGDVIARIADLKTFRVEATVSDVHAKTLTIGQVAKVKVGEETVEGQLTNILPTIQNGIITVVVGLADKSNAMLRSNLRVDVLIVTDSKTSTLFVKKGPAINGSGPQDIFVLRGGQAVKTPVKIGISSFDTCEIVEGAAEGDEIVISDMRDYIHLRELNIRESRF